MTTEEQSMKTTPLVKKTSVSFEYQSEKTEDTSEVVALTTPLMQD